MDGNNRWSKRNKINPYEAYIKGSKKLLEISEFIFSNYNTKYITAFALSKNNLKRPIEKIKLLKSVIEYFLDDLSKISQFKFKILVKGNINFLNKRLIKKINELNSKNNQYSKCLIILINYSGQSDIIDAVKHLVKSKKKINKLNFEKNLFLNNIPNPDILIRTGSFQRISNFMLYQLAFTDFFFLKKLWPDISRQDLIKIFEKYKKIDRKFGL